MILSLRCADSDVAIFRATISGCSEPHSASEMRTFSLSPLPDRNGRKLHCERGGTTRGSFRFGECYLLTVVQYFTRVPRFRLPAPLRGSTPRQFFILSFDFRYLCRSAQNDTEADCYIGDILFIRHSNIATNGLHTTDRHTLRVILSGAAQQCNGERENQPLPRSRTPKGRRQAESRHLYKVLS